VILGRTIVPIQQFQYAIQLLLALKRAAPLTNTMVISAADVTRAIMIVLDPRHHGLNIVIRLTKPAPNPQPPEASMLTEMVLRDTGVTTRADTNHQPEKGGKAPRHHLVGERRLTVTITREVRMKLRTPPILITAVADHAHGTGIAMRDGKLLLRFPRTNNLVITSPNEITNGPDPNALTIGSNLDTLMEERMSKLS